MKIILAGIFAFCFLQATAQDIENKPAKNTALVPIPDGPSVLGVFDGRSPCKEIARQLEITPNPACNKIKWRLILYHDSLTHAPTHYMLEGFVYRNPAREGKWAIIKGTGNYAGKEIYQLDPDKAKGSIYILKGDNNVLFFLDQNQKLMQGNENFSYVLYRTRN